MSKFVSSENVALQEVQTPVQPAAGETRTLHATTTLSAPFSNALTAVGATAPSHSSYGIMADPPGNPKQQQLRRPSLSDSFLGSSFSTLASRSLIMITHSQLQGDDVNRVVTEIGSFVHAQEEVTRLRVLAQQKRVTLKQKREKVIRCDEAVMNAIRQAHGEETALDSAKFKTLFEASQQARDELGPLEDDYDTTEFMLVPKEFALTESSEKIARQYQILTDSTIEEPAETDLSSHISYERLSSLHQGKETDATATGTPWKDQHTMTLDELTSMLGGKRREGSLDEDPDRSVHSLLSVGSTRAGGSHEQTIEQYAPDLSSSKPWSLVRSCPETGQSAPYVLDQDLTSTGSTNANSCEEGKDLQPSPISPFWRDLTNLQQAHNRMNTWLLDKLSVSRWEISRLREAIARETENVWGWADQALAYWNSDGATKSPVPISRTVSSASFGVTEGSLKHDDKTRTIYKYYQPVTESAFEGLIHSQSAIDSNPFQAPKKRTHNIVAPRNPSLISSAP